MRAKAITQMNLKELELRVSRRITPARLRRLVRSSFPRIYIELMERDSPAGLVDDLFRLAGNHGQIHALVEALLRQWPGLRHASIADAIVRISTPRTARVSSLLLLLLGPTEDIARAREDLAVTAPGLPLAPSEVGPEAFLPRFAALPAFKPLKPTPPPPPLTSMHRLQPLLKRALAPCARQAGGGFHLGLEVFSDARGRWSQTRIVGGYSSSFHHCLTRRIDGLRAGRRDKFPANDRAPIFLIYP